MFSFRENVWLPYGWIEEVPTRKWNVLSPRESWRRSHKNAKTANIRTFLYYQ